MHEYKFKLKIIFKIKSFENHYIMKNFKRTFYTVSNLYSHSFISKAFCQQF
jgi:hypothetical protein